MHWANNRSLPFFLLGKGANILIGDKGYRGVVIKNEARGIEISSDYQQVSHRQDKVKEEFALELQTEISFVGEF